MNSKPYAWGLVRVYTKTPGKKPDFDEPVVLADHRGGCNP
jgi:hypothetical protein